MAMLGLTWPATLKRFLPSQGIGMISQVQVKVLKIQMMIEYFFIQEVT